MSKPAVDFALPNIVATSRRNHVRFERRSIEEFDDCTLATFYQNVFDALALGGTFFTSGAARRV